mmetsp:Transcript_915/g.3860  ORF Transcript_915/g.3860 Transcript_915/m.3860 type:complete len:381 (-) Transcript_915:2018-3160(-)
MSAATSASASASSAARGSVGVPFFLAAREEPAFPRLRRRAGQRRDHERVRPVPGRGAARLEHLPSRVAVGERHDVRVQDTLLLGVPLVLVGARRGGRAKHVELRPETVARPAPGEPRAARGHDLQHAPARVEVHVPLGTVPPVDLVFVLVRPGKQDDLVVVDVLADAAPPFFAETRRASGELLHGKRLVVHAAFLWVVEALLRGVRARVRQRRLDRAAHVPERQHGRPAAVLVVPLGRDVNRAVKEHVVLAASRRRPTQTSVVTHVDVRLETRLVPAFLPLVILLVIVPSRRVAPYLLGGVEETPSRFLRAVHVVVQRRVEGPRAEPRLDVIRGHEPRAVDVHLGVPAERPARGVITRNLPGERVEHVRRSLDVREVKRL